MENIFLVSANFVFNLLPGSGANSHIRAEKQHFAAVGHILFRAYLCVALKRNLSRGHIVIRNRSGSAHNLRIFGEKPADRLDPVRANHAVGVKSSDNIAGRVRNSVVARGDQSLLFVLFEEDNICVRVRIDVIADQLSCVVG